MTPARPLRVLLLGSDSGLTRAAVKGAQQAGAKLMVAQRGCAPASSPIPLESPAQRDFARRGVAQLFIDSANKPAAQRQFADFVPDVILTACYGEILRSSALRLAPLGAFNLHPSLLPAFRGPDPLHEQMQCGARNFGVTLHELTQAVDAGPIVSQYRLAPIHGDAARGEIARRLAHAAGLLAEAALARLARGEKLPVRHQAA